MHDRGIFPHLLSNYDIVKDYCFYIGLIRLNLEVVN